MERRPSAAIGRYVAIGSGPLGVAAAALLGVAAAALLGVAAAALLAVAAGTLLAVAAGALTTLAAATLLAGAVSTTAASTAALAGPFALLAPALGGGPAFVTFDYAPTPQTLHLGVYFAVTVALLAVGYWILATRQTRGARLFAATLLLASVRTGVDVLRIVVGELWTFHRFAAGVALLVQLLVALTFLRFAARYADEPSLLDPRTVWSAGGLTVVVGLLLATDRWHGLVIDAHVESVAPFVHGGVEPGLVGWVVLGLTFAALLAGAGLLARSFTVTERPDWWSAAMLTMGISLAAVVVVLGFLDQLPLRTFDYHGAAIAGFLALTTPALLGHGLRRIEISARESMLRELDDPIVILDDKRNVVDFTAAATRLLPADAVGQRFESVLEFSPDWPDVDETVTVEVDRSEVVPGAADEDPEYYLVQLSPVTSETGDVIGYTVRFADVTDLKRRTAELARKNEQLDQFADTISHDLREPLAVASEHVRRLEEAVDAASPDGTLEAGTVHEHLDAIERSLQRMGHIIDDLLALARDTDPVTDVESVPFGEVVDDAWALVDPRMGDLHVDGGGTIQADRECLQRTLENFFRLLADGAESSAPADTSTALSDRGVQVVAGLTPDGFYVTAGGSALPDDVEELTVEGSETPGEEHRSLELSIVDHLVDAHGWTFTVDTAGSGIRFEIADAITSSEEPLAGEAP